MVCKNGMDIYIIGYDTKTKEPLRPRYISTVDSGNFIGYLYVTKAFLEEIQERLQNQDNLHFEQSIGYKKNRVEYDTISEGNTLSKEQRNKVIETKRTIDITNEEEKVKIQNQIQEMLEIIKRIIKQTDFTYLYSQEHQIFSIGYNIEEKQTNRLVL